MPVALVALLGIFALFSFCIRATFMSSAYGIIESELPVMSVPFADPDHTAYQEAPRGFLAETTPVVILTENEFYFGNLDAFTEDFTNVRNKFIVSHEEGAPNLHKLVETMAKWQGSLIKNDLELPREALIFLPMQNVPMAIVLQVMAELKKTSLFNQVILATGII